MSQSLEEEKKKKKDEKRKVGDSKQTEISEEIEKIEGTTESKIKEDLDSDVDFEMLNEEIEDIPLLEIKKRKPAEIKFSKKDNFLIETLDETIAMLINQTSLRNSEQQISKDEMHQTQFSLNFVRTLNHYFPKWSFDHPALGLGVSSISLLILLNNKKPLQALQQKPINDERKTEVSGIAPKTRTSGDSANNNPYLHLAKHE